jgi:hypothetical protein
VFPISIRDGRMLVLARIQVGKILPVEVVAEHPDWFEPVLQHPQFRRHEPHLDSPSARAFWLLRLWLDDHPQVDAFCPGEADEVVIAKESSAVRLDIAVPPETVKALQWQPRRKPARPIKHLSADGRIERSISLQGVYRLTQEGGDLLGALVEWEGARRKLPDFYALSVVANSGSVKCASR